MKALLFGEIIVIFFPETITLWSTTERQITFYEVNAKKKTKKFCCVKDVNRKFTFIVKYLVNSFLKDDVNKGYKRLSSAIPWKVPKSQYEQINYIYLSKIIIKKKKKKAERKNESQCARLIEKQLETTIFINYYLNRASSFHVDCNSISKVLQWGFYSMNFLCISKKDVFQRIFILIQMHPSKVV